MQFGACDKNPFYPSKHVNAYLKARGYKLTGIPVPKRNTTCCFTKLCFEARNRVNKNLSEIAKKATGFHMVKSLTSKERENIGVPARTPARLRGEFLPQFFQAGKFVYYDFGEEEKGKYQKKRKALKCVEESSSDSESDDPKVKRYKYVSEENEDQNAVILKLQKDLKDLKVSNLRCDVSF